MGNTKETEEAEKGGRAVKEESPADGGDSKVAAASPGNLAAGSGSPPSPAVYEEGEKVLAFHGPRIYESKVRVSLNLVFPAICVNELSLEVLGLWISERASYISPNDL